MTVQKTLTPDGARLLRAARDRIIANPAEFNMADWDCGTTACIGGWMCRLAGIPYRGGEDDVLSRLCGFGGLRGLKLISEGHPFYELFYGEWMNEEGAERDVNQAAEHINAFLWKYGYPADEIPQSDDAVRQETGFAHRDHAR